MYGSKSGTEFYKAVWCALIDADKSQKELVAAVEVCRGLHILT